MGRAPCCDKANVKKGPWAPEEDAKLKDFIDKYGTGGNWIALPQKAGLNRCGKSCRLRWLNYLRPNIKHGEFSEEEERIICSLFANIGSRWSIIAAQLPGRTDNDIKNYWNTKLKKKLLGIVSTHHCKTQHHHQLQLQQQQQQQQQQQLLQHYLSPLVTSSSSLMQTPKLEAFAGFGDPPLAAAFYQNALGFASRSNRMINFGSDPSSSSSSSSCATVQLEYGCDDGKGFEEEQITASVDHYSFRGLEEYSRLLAGAETTPVHYTYEEAIKNLLSSN